MLTRVYRRFDQFLKADADVVPLMSSRPLFSSSFPTHFSQIIVSYETEYCQLNHKYTKEAYWLCLVKG
jgi:hypothetical protein